MEDVTLSFEVHQAAQVSLTFKWVVRLAGLSGAQGGLGTAVSGLELIPCDL